MESNRKRILVITNEQRLAKISSVIRKAFQDDCAIEIEAVTVPDPDYHQTLKEYDDKGFDVAFIDDEVAPDKNRLEHQIIVFSSAPRAYGKNMRIVFLASPERDPSDSFISNLIDMGIHDFVIPQAEPPHINPLLKAALLVRIPQNYSHVAVQRRRSVVSPQYDPKMATRPTYDEDGIKAAAKLPSLGKRNIGVIGSKRFTGTSHVAQILARSTANAGFKTALIISKHDDFTSIKDFMCYDSVSKEGAISVAGVDIYEGTSIAQTNELQVFSVYDFQVAITGKPLAPDKKDLVYLEAAALNKAWSNCDCKVLVTTTSPQNIKFLEKIISETEPVELNKWNIVLNLTSERMKDFIQAAILTKAPEANVVILNEITDPLANPDIPEFAQSIFMKSFGTRLENKVTDKNGILKPARGKGDPKDKKPSGLLRRFVR